MFGWNIFVKNLTCTNLTKHRIKNCNLTMKTIQNFNAHSINLIVWSVLSEVMRGSPQENQTSERRFLPPIVSRAAHRPLRSIAWGRHRSSALPRCRHLGRYAANRATNACTDFVASLYWPWLKRFKFDYSNSIDCEFLENSNVRIVAASCVDRLVMR